MSLSIQMQLKTFIILIFLNSFTSCLRRKNSMPPYTFFKAILINFTIPRFGRYDNATQYTTESLEISPLTLSLTSPEENFIRNMYTTESTISAKAFDSEIYIPDVLLEDDDDGSMYNELVQEYEKSLIPTVLTTPVFYKKMDKFVFYEKNKTDADKNNYWPFFVTTVAGKENKNNKRRFFPFNHLTTFKKSNFTVDSKKSTISRRSVVTRKKVETTTKFVPHEKIIRDRKSYEEEFSKPKNERILLNPLTCWEGITFREYNERKLTTNACRDKNSQCQFYRIDFLSFRHEERKDAPIASFIEEWRCGTKRQCENWKDMLKYAADNVFSYTGNREDVKTTFYFYCCSENLCNKLTSREHARMYVLEKRAANSAYYIKEIHFKKDRLFFYFMLIYIFIM